MNKQENRCVIAPEGMIVYTLERKNVKNLNLRVRPDGWVYVSAGRLWPPDRIDAFVISKASFILDAQKRCREREAQAAARDEKTFFLLGRKLKIQVTGSREDKVDVAIVAQGYNGMSDPQLRVDYYRMKEILFGQEPFKSHRDDFNVYGVKADVDAEFGTFGIDRYLMTFSLWKLHDALGTTPCDYIIIMVNDERYGGGAIYNFYAVTSMHRLAEYVLPHEFGHAFGGLADEYVDEDLAYGNLHINDYEPLEPNITNLKDFGRKWKTMLPAGTKVPTPDNVDVPKNECGPLGVYEGAGYAHEGVYRPAMHCMMRDYAPFCPVCTKRLEEVFSMYAK